MPSFLIVYGWRLILDSVTLSGPKAEIHCFSRMTFLLCLWFHFSCFWHTISSHHCAFYVYKMACSWSSDCFLLDCCPSIFSKVSKIFSDLNFWLNIWNYFGTRGIWTLDGESDGDVWEDRIGPVHSWLQYQ